MTESDPILFCIYCGDTMEALTKKQIKVFGKPTCCDFKMLEVEREKLHTVVRAMDVLKSNFEAEILKDVL